MKKDYAKKLAIKLNKQTISILNYSKLNQIKGGKIKGPTCEMDCCSIGHTYSYCQK